MKKPSLTGDALKIRKHRFPSLLPSTGNAQGKRQVASNKPKKRMLK